MASSNGIGTRVEVLELQQDGSTYTWAPARVTWAKIALTNKRNIFSVHGIGVAGVSFIIRRQPLTLNSAIRWQGQHCFITGILPADYGHLTVEAALVELSQCEDRYTDTRFPAVMTEKYLGHQQLEPLAINTLRHVLVTPKYIQLTPGKLVEVDGVSWPIQVAHLLDPHKNEYELERTVDL